MTFVYGAFPSKNVEALSQYPLLLGNALSNFLQKNLREALNMKKNRFQKVYEILCPEDVLEYDDPRRPAIIAEMKDVACAASIDEAVKVIAWWNVWPNAAHETPEQFVKDVRRLLEKGT